MAQDGEVVALLFAAMESQPLGGQQAINEVAHLLQEHPHANLNIFHQIHGCTVLAQAITLGSAALADLFLSHGNLDPNSTAIYRDGVVPLRAFDYLCETLEPSLHAQCPRLALIKRFLVDGRVSVESPYDFYGHPLYVLASRGCLFEIKCWLASARVLDYKKVVYGSNSLPDDSAQVASNKFELNNMLKGAEGIEAHYPCRVAFRQELQWP